MASAVAAIVITAIVGAAVGAGTSAAEGKKARDLSEKLAEKARLQQERQYEEQKRARELQAWQAQGAQEQQELIQQLAFYETRLNQLDSRIAELEKPINDAALNAAGGGDSLVFPLVTGGLIGVAVMSIFEQKRPN